MTIKDSFPSHVLSTPQAERFVKPLSNLVGERRSAGGKLQVEATLLALIFSRDTTTPPDNLSRWIKERAANLVSLSVVRGLRVGWESGVTFGSPQGIGICNSGGS